MPDGKITLEIDAKIKQAEKNLSQFGKEITKTEKKLDSLQTSWKSLETQGQNKILNLLRLVI